MERVRETEKERVRERSKERGRESSQYHHRYRLEEWEFIRYQFLHDSLSMLKQTEKIIMEKISLSRCLLYTLPFRFVTRKCIRAHFFSLFSSCLKYNSYAYLWIFTHMIFSLFSWYSRQIKEENDDRKISFPSSQSASFFYFFFVLSLFRVLACKRAHIPLSFLWKIPFLHL